MIGVFIIENTKEAQETFGYGWGASHYAVTPDQIKALAAGKQMAIDGGEYVSFVSLQKPEGSV